MITEFLQISLGLLTENAGEWMFHRYILHGLGKHHNSIWNYHLGEHHRIARDNDMLDPGYKLPPTQWNSQGKEVALLLLIVAITLPFLTIFPWYVSGVYSGLTFYYIKHRRSHLDREWAASHLPWHCQHHLSAGLEANWCVSWPWFDWIIGTRVRVPQNDTTHYDKAKSNTDSQN